MVIRIVGENIGEWEQDFLLYIYLYYFYLELYEYSVNSKY